MNAHKNELKNSSASKGNTFTDSEKEVANKRKAQLEKNIAVLQDVPVFAGLEPDQLEQVRSWTPPVQLARRARPNLLGVLWSGES